MRAPGAGEHDARLRALIVILWRAGRRIDEALALAETDLEPRRRSILVRRDKGGKRREIGMDEWAGGHTEFWRRIRPTMPIGPFPCVIHSATRGRPWSQTGARDELRRVAAAAGVRRGFAPHELRQAHTVEMAREGVPLPVIQRHLGHAHLNVTSTHLRGIDTAEIIETIHSRRAPMIPVSAGLRLEDSWEATKPVEGSEVSGRGARCCRDRDPVSAAALSPTGVAEPSACPPDRGGCGVAVSWTHQWRADLTDLNDPGTLRCGFDGLVGVVRS